jgi:hypothetical protein
MNIGKDWRRSIGKGRRIDGKGKKMDWEEWESIV